MIDAIGRKKVIRAVQLYLNGDIDNFQLDDDIDDVSRDDKLLSMITHGVWLFYDDCKRHKNNGVYIIEGPALRFINRLCFALSSGYDMKDDEPGRNIIGRICIGILSIFGYHPVITAYYPFSSLDQWKSIDLPLDLYEMTWKME